MSHADTPNTLDIRYVGAISGRYTLLTAGPAGTGEVYACRTQSLSPSLATIAAPVGGEVGQHVTLLLDHIGFIKGTVRGLAAGGFHIDIAASDEERSRLAARIGWLKANRLRKAVDKRASPRRLPRRPAATFHIGEEAHDCFIVDYSPEGAGISARLRPPIGAPLRLGSIPAHVVRHMDVGFGVRFDSPADPATVEAAIGARPA